MSEERPPHQIREGATGQGNPHPVWGPGRIAIAIVLLLVVVLIVIFALEPILRLGMFLGLVAPHLSAK
jgi:hypothetical protein